MTPLSLASFGVVADGKKDNADLINYAATVAKAQGQPLSLPAGVVAYVGVITLDSVLLSGEGDESVLWALDPNNEAIYLRGRGAGVRCLRLSGVVPTERMSPWECSRVVAREGATLWVMHDITVDTASAAGLVAEGASEGSITKCRVRNTLADAIHMTNASHHITVAHNVVERAGDDGIACVSYRPDDSASRSGNRPPRRRRLGTPRDGDTGLVSQIHAHHNMIRGNLHGRVMSVVGGENVLYESNQLLDNPTAAGMYLAQEDSWNTYGVHNVIARFNTIHNCGDADKGHTAIMLFTDGDVDPNTDVTLQRNAIQQDDDERGGIRVFGNCTGVKVDSNMIVSSDPLIIQTPDVVVLPFTEGAVGIRE
jgi:hypothetical protein